MKTLFLADLKEMTEKQILDHLATQYAGDEPGSYSNCYNADDVQISKAIDKLVNIRVLIAYESVGDYGCDSSSFFLLRNGMTKELFEVHGSHCSCYGFEGQLSLEPTTIEALKARCDKGYLFSTGGYDGASEANQEAVRKFIQKLK